MVEIPRLRGQPFSPVDRTVLHFHHAGVTRLGPWNPQTSEERLDGLEFPAMIRQFPCARLAVDAKDVDALVALFAPDVLVQRNQRGPVLGHEPPRPTIGLGVDQRNDGLTTHILPGAFDALDAF